MVLSKNKKAFYDYEIIESYEAGISLFGAEVKGIKNKEVSIKEAFVSFSENGKQLILKNAHVSIPQYANNLNINSTRERVLLLRKSEIEKIKKAVKVKGFTIIPISVRINEHGLIKIDIALAKGKKNYDKRETIKKRDLERRDG